MATHARQIAVLFLVAPAVNFAAAEPIQILRTGLWHGAEVRVEAGFDWWGIFPEGDGFTLQPAPVTITHERDAIMDDPPGVLSGKRVTVPQKTIPVLLLRGLKALEAGRLEVPQAVQFPTFVYPGRRIELKLMNGKGPEFVGISVEGKCRTQSNVNDLILENYSVSLHQGREQSIRPQALFTIPGPSDGRPRLKWAGDLDRDGKIDLLYDRTDHYNVSHLVLFLSSAAKEGEYVGLVAEWKTTGC